jgi:hypothetical protein
LLASRQSAGIFEAKRDETVFRIADGLCAGSASRHVCAEEAQRVSVSCGKKLDREVQPIAVNRKVSAEEIEADGGGLGCVQS